MNEKTKEERAERFREGARTQDMEMLADVLASLLGPLKGTPNPETDASVQRLADGFYQAGMDAANSYFEAYRYYYDVYPPERDHLYAEMAKTMGGENS